MGVRARQRTDAVAASADLTSAGIVTPPTTRFRPARLAAYNARSASASRMAVYVVHLLEVVDVAEATA